MAKKEKFGKFVLLAELGSSGLGIEHRAAKLSSTGLEKVVHLLRLSPHLTADTERARALMEQIKLAAQLQNPNIIKVLGIGKVEATYYVSSEFVESKSLAGVFARCRSEGFPFSVDHALLIVSKVCSALEYSHARRGDAGARYFHGLVAPQRVAVSYEGEVRVGGFGFWQGGVGSAAPLESDEMRYIAPEQRTGSGADTRSDTFAAGALLFEALTGQPLLETGSEDVPARVAAARLQNPSGSDDSLPKAISDILQRSLAMDPAGRYGEIQEMRKAIDTLLFSGDFTPTTFNLAFFMHSLFREEIDQEARVLKQEREASYLEFLTDETVALATPTPGAAPAAAPEAAAPPPAEAAEPSAPAAAPAPRAPTPIPTPATSHEPAIGVRPPTSGSKAPLIAGIVVVLLAAAGGGYYLLRGAAPAAPVAPAPSTLTPEGAAALAKVKELEAKLASLESEREAAAQAAEDEARQKIEAQARAKGQQADPAAVAKAQAEARRKAQEEQQQRVEEEKRRLEEEKRAEEARLAEERRKAEEAAAAAAAAAAVTEAPAPTTAAAAPPTTVAPPPTTVPPTTLPALKAGDLVNISDPGVIAPVVEDSPRLRYPPLALRQRIEGSVELNALVDEKGRVADVQVVVEASGGLTDAAVDNVKKRRYRPATKNGVPVKVWIPVRVSFKLP